MGTRLSESGMNRISEALHRRRAYRNPPETRIAPRPKTDDLAARSLVRGVLQPLKDKIVDCRGPHECANIDQRWSRRLEMGTRHKGFDVGILEISLLYSRKASQSSIRVGLPD